MLAAANEFSKVADVVFVSNYTLNATTGLYERNDNVEYKPGPLGPEAGVQYAAGVDDSFDADFFYFSYPGTPGPGISLLGSMNPPDNGDEGVAQFNSADERWNAQMLQPGGFSFVTLIHEFGHGMGLAHPHDTGGGSSIMQGVNPSGVPGDDGGAGAFDLNQGINTMMSYNDGWEMSPYGQPETNNEGYGWLGSLMALDIAVIQDKYGVNEDWATGNDTYVLKDVNEWGVYIDSATGQPAVHDATNQATARDGYYEGQSTFYSSIWDADGNDTIVYEGARAANIDLRAATLQYEYGGAGWMSYANGIYGGFTIANGVTIENATGGDGDDVLIGNAAANVLTGGGGSDRMEGGTGNDAYYIDAADTVIEAAGAGFDAIFTDASYVLAAGLEIEWLTARTVYGTEAINLTGNELANYVLGNQGGNILNGGGGADALVGYGGNDTYVINNATDIVIEVAGAGFDAAYTATSFSLATGVSIEWLAASAVYGTVAMNLTGNEFANTILGNSGANILTGGGGADAMVGYGGNDVYYVDDAGDVIVETGGGFDAVYTSASYTLTVSAEVEWLSTEAVYGTAAINLTGNDFGNYVLGNDGANVLDGGAGADVIAGYGGADTFAFSTALGVGNVDSIVDFAAGTDKIGLDDAVFGALGGPGALNAAAFATGAGAADGSDRIIYNSASGQLFYDADGAGGTAQILFATLSAGLALTASDFAVI
jgi:Ca2+-binding RTX toxin-like protein